MKALLGVRRDLQKKANGANIVGEIFLTLGKFCSPNHNKSKGS